MAIKKVNAFLSGVLLGGLTGAAVALLLAPQPGEDTRELIRDRSIDLRDKAVSKVEDTREIASEIGHRGQKAITEQRNRIEHMLENVKQSKLEKLAITNGEKEVLTADVA